MAKRPVRHAMAYVTAPDRTTARRIACAIVDRRLAACANWWPVDSVYRWHNAREEAREFVILFKTRQALLQSLIREVRRLHPDEVPCIVSYPMGTAFSKYVNWIDAETTYR